jgi:hypothetical protein
MMSNARTGDSESNVEVLREGFASVASWISRDPDNESFVFRKFDNLAARNLLYLQCELIELERRLRVLDDEARQSMDMELRQSARTWESFVANAKEREQEKSRMILVKEIRLKLEEYRKKTLEGLSQKLMNAENTLLRQAQIAQLDRPSYRVFRMFRNWLSGGLDAKTGKKMDPVLGGRAMDMLDERQDLVALRTPKDSDPLSRLLQNHWPFPVSIFFIRH